jgi:hypothetical protein
MIEYPFILDIHKTIYRVQHNSCIINGESSRVITRQLHNLNSSQDVTRAIKLHKKKLAKHVAFT